MLTSLQRSTRCALPSASVSRMTSRPNLGYLSAALLVLVLGSSCLSPDPHKWAREKFALAELEPSVAAYKTFLIARPDEELFADEIERAETFLSEAERERLLALEFSEQVSYLKNPRNQLARSEVLALALAHLPELPRIERLQWALDLVAPCRADTDESLRVLRSIFAPPGAPAQKVSDEEFGPAEMTGLERAKFAAGLSVTQFTEPLDQEMATAYLLAISTDTTSLRWVQAKYEHDIRVEGTPTTPRKEALEALAQLVGPGEMPALAAMHGTLTGERAWSVVEDWLHSENSYVESHLLYPGILQIQGRGVEESALDLAEQYTWPDHLPAVLEAVWRRLPKVQERVPEWLNSERWEDQTAAAYALALNNWDTTGLDARLTELEGSDRRFVRSAVALVRSGLELESEGASEAATALEASVGPDGAASSKRFLELSARGFLKASDTSYVDLSQPLPDLDLSEDSPLQVFSSFLSRYGAYSNREETFTALKAHYTRLQNAQSPKAGALSVRQTYDADENDSVVACVLTVAVLEREPGLLLDPEVEGRWLAWPDIYYCYLDTERDEVLAAYHGLFEDRLLPVPPDVDQAAREIFAVTGIHEEYSGLEGGLILVVPPNFLKNRSRYPFDLLKESRIQLGHAVGPIRGRTLHPWETRWLWITNTLTNLPPGDPHQTAILIDTMANGLPEARFPSELVFAPSDGVVTEVEVQESASTGKTGLHVVIKGSGGVIELDGLVVANVEVGTSLKRGQWIGLRRCE